MSAPQLMTPAEVAAAFGVNSATVLRWAKTRKLESILTPGGHAHRYFTAQVDAFLSGRPLTPEQVQALKAQLGGAAVTGIQQLIAIIAVCITVASVASSLAGAHAARYRSRERENEGDQ